MSEPGPEVGSEQGWRPPSLAAKATVGTAGSPKEDLEQIRQRAHDEGYAEGLAAGRAQGESIAAEMGVLLQAMAQPFREADAALIRELVALVERVLGVVLDRELESGAYDIQGALADALKVLGSVSVPVELSMHPADVALCRELGLPAEPTLNVVEDATLTRGGLRLKAGPRVVDASIEARLSQVLTTLRDTAGVPDPASTRASGTDAKPDSDVESEGS